MTPEVMAFAQQWLGELHFGTALEVGSRDVNGTLRQVVQAQEYLGVDLEEGPGVDRVLDATLPEVPDWLGTFDLVLCTEVLEHVPDLGTLVENLVRCTAPFGHLLVTTVGPGFPHHGYPVDRWRFTTDVLAQLFAPMHTLATATREYPTGGSMVAWWGRNTPRTTLPVPLPRWIATHAA